MLECSILRRRSKAKRAEKGETCSKYFFATLKAKQLRERMEILRDEEDREIRIKEIILDYVYNYYAELYTQPAVSAEHQQEQEETLNLIDR
ncbi:hypothetical protein R1flu_020355 [Riccia fluitans]|uniref:Uncharacterized protein n=1 Tax=Riccia fluitans TaxID=41844 RepID=A0ABD1ZLQ4_9MARC